MSNLIIPGQTRQQRRDAQRTAVKSGTQTIDLIMLIDNFNNEIQAIHHRLNEAFECMRLMGLTTDMYNEAQENVNARMKIV